MAFWTISGEPEVFDGPDGRDGCGYKWPLAREGKPPLFTMVYVSRHALGNMTDDAPMTERALRAVETRGRSEVERYLDRELPVRVIKVGTVGNPRVLAERL
jgi:hypothetical protein